MLKEREEKKKAAEKIKKDKDGKTVSFTPHEDGAEDEEGTPVDENDHSSSEGSEEEDDDDDDDDEDDNEQWADEVQLNLAK